MLWRTWSMRLFQMNDTVYDEQTIGEMFHSLDLKQLEYLYDVLSMIIDQRVIEGDVCE